MQLVRPDHGPGSAVATIMKLSFDEEHKVIIYLFILNAYYSKMFVK